MKLLVLDVCLSDTHPEHKGKIWSTFQSCITPEDDVSAVGCCRVLSLTEHLVVCAGTALIQSLLCENPTMHLPWLKRERLWSVMLNADKRTIEMKGKPNSSAFNTLFRNLEMCCLSL